MSSEPDAVRERLSYLRDHPDLCQLEPAVMGVTARMSQRSWQLPDIYSDEKIARAKVFLQQRQEEAESQQDLIVKALHTTQGLRKWAHPVDLEASIVALQLDQLDERFQAILPRLGYQFNGSDDTVVTLTQKPAAE